MKLLFSIALITSIQLTGYAQTKKIAHRSHSGSNQTFSLNSLDNFGETPEMIRAWEEEQRRKEIEKATKKGLEKSQKEQEKEAIKVESVEEEIGASGKASGNPQKVENPTPPAPKSKKELRKEKKKMRRETKKKPKQLKAETAITSTVDKVDADVSMNENDDSESHEAVAPISNKTPNKSESQASVNWIILLLLIVLPSIFAIKSINVKL